jgi:hypothetical protein
MVPGVAEYLQCHAERLGEEGGDAVVATLGAGEDPFDLAALIRGVRPMLNPPLAAGERVEEAGTLPAA